MATRYEMCKRCPIKNSCPSNRTGEYMDLEFCLRQQDNNKIIEKNGGLET